MNEQTTLQQEIIRAIMNATDEQVAETLRLWHEQKENDR